MLTPFQTRARGALTESPIFKDLADDCMRWVHPVSVRKGEILLEKGEPSTALFGLICGTIKLCAADETGRQISFGLLGPGGLIGEIGISSGAPQHANVVALAHCELAAIKSRDLNRLLERHLELRNSLAHAAAEAALRLSQRIEDAAFLTTEARIEKTLLDFTHRFGERIDGGIRVALRQQDLADVLGLSRESVNRVLTSGSMRGRIELGRGRIVLLGA